MPSELLRDRVEARPGVALPHGLLSASTVLPIGDVHEQLGVDWQPLSCDVAATTGWCPPDPGDPDREKVFSRIADATAPPVTVYAGVECSVTGWTYAEGIDRARATLSVGEQAALEGWVWEQLAPTAGDVSSEIGDQSVVGRLAELENAFAGTYSGVGVVHVPIVLSPFMATHGLLVRDGPRLRTWSGHFVSLGAGYPATDPNGDDPSAGSAWLMISGPVTVRQGDVTDAPGSDAAAIDRESNDRRALAERTSVVQVECGAFMASVDKECCSSDVTSS